MVRKHPHARGEDKHTRSTLRLKVETPPRTWGRQFVLPDQPEGTGNTPTHVGKTPLIRLSRTPIGKHPHARGEDSPSLPAARQKKETPPRTWGRPASAATHGDTSGNTPTHVGKTAWENAEMPPCWKHPHARGEDVCYIRLPVRLFETPPRTWGRPEGAAAGVAALGNTPTHVGKTVCNGASVGTSEKHPHARGEDR